MKSVITVVLLLSVVHIVPAQRKDDTFLKELFSKNQHPVFQQIIGNPEKHRVQLIYTQINRDKNNIPHFNHHTFYLDSNNYFNPASTVKLPAAVLALEKLHQLPRKITKDTWLKIDSAYEGQRKLTDDESAPDSKATIGHFIKRAFIVSENEPYNRLYEFVGQDYLNTSLWDKGYRNTRITRRFAAFTEEQNRHTNPFEFLDAQGNTLYRQPLTKSEMVFDFNPFPLIGKAHYKGNELVQGGMDFSRANNLPLFELQQMLQTILFPEAVPEKQRFKLTEEDYRFLYQYLSQLPGETNYPKYDEQDFYPNYAKFFFRDSTHRDLPKGVRVFNKVGWAYGFLTDASYIVDFENNIEFMLTATVYVNENEVLNDGKYEYEEMGHPFLYQLGQTIYNHELARERPHAPDLSRFNVTYEQRKQDDRLTLKEKDVDN